MVRPKCQSTPLIGCYSRLEEALESWHHVVTDKIVYLAEFPIGNDDPFGFVSELNAELDRWIEVNLVLRGKRETQYSAIVRAAHDGRHIGWKSHLNLGYGRMERNPSMFVDVPEPMQAPQFSGLISIPTVVWLQVINDLDGSGCNSGNRIVERPAIPAVPTPYDRKTSTSIGCTTGSQRQECGKVIQRCTEAGCPVAHDQAHNDREWTIHEAHDVLSSFKIILSRDQVWLAP